MDQVAVIVEQDIDEGYIIHGIFKDLETALAAVLDLPARRIHEAVIELIPMNVQLKRATQYSAFIIDGATAMYSLSGEKLR